MTTKSRPRIKANVSRTARDSSTTRIFFIELRMSPYFLRSWTVKRQVDEESGSPTHLTLDQDIAAVLLDNLVRNGKPQTHPFFFCSEEGIEDVLEILFRNSHAGIPNADLNKLVGAIFAEKPCGYLDHAFALDRLKRVQNNVHGYLFYLFFVNKNLREVRSQAAIDLDPLFLCFGV